MDDIVNSVPSWMFTAIIAVCILFIIGIIFARLYRRASAEQAFVRTGLGGQKVVMSGGAIVMPIFHEIGNDSNLLIVFYVQIMPDDFVMQLHRF